MKLLLHYFIITLRKKKISLTHISKAKAREILKTMQNNKEEVPSELSEEK